MSLFTGTGGHTSASSSGQSGVPLSAGPSIGGVVRVSKRIWWVAGFLVLVVAAIVMDSMAPRPSSSPATAEKPSKPLSLSPQKTEHESWLVTAQGDLRSMREQLDQMARKQELMEQTIKMQDRAAKTVSNPIGVPSPAPSSLGSQWTLRSQTGDLGSLPGDAPPVMRATSAGSSPTSAAASQSRATPSPGATSEGRAPSPPPSMPPSTAPAAPMPVGPPTAGPLVAPVQAGKPGPSTAQAGSTQPQKLRVIEADHRAIVAKYWLPTGTILPVRLLSGLDAPTGAGGGAGGAAASSPHPVLMEIIEWAKLPNDTTLDAVGCFALGEGIGDISMERAMIRVLGLSCVKSDGMAVDLPIKGVVTGEDGKVGLRGRMVIRESAMLARALITGFVSGISKAFMPFQMGFMVAPNMNQALQLPGPQQVGLAGMAGGMQQAAALLARHYAQMAAKIYPVIEVDAGRWADLIVTEGRELTAELK